MMPKNYDAKRIIPVMVVFLFLLGLGALFLLTQGNAPANPILSANFSGTPPANNPVVMLSGGSAMMIAECSNLSFIEDASDYILDGTLEGLGSKWNSEHNRIYTYSDFKINSYIKGSPFGTDTISLVAEGGCVEGICENSEDSPILSAGNKRLYLAKSDNGELTTVCKGIRDLATTER